MEQLRHLWRGASSAARAFGGWLGRFPKIPKIPKVPNTLGINGFSVGTQFQPCIGNAGEETARGGVALRYGSVRPEDVERGAVMITSGRVSKSHWEVLGILGIVAKRLGICPK